MPTFNGAYDWDQLPDVTLFKNQTAHQEPSLLGITKKRGTIESVDGGLERWATVKKGRDLEEMIVALADLSARCDKWINSKIKKNAKAKDGSTTRLRMAAVEKIKVALEKNMRFLAIYHETNYAKMQARKQTNAYQASHLARLSGGYEHERNFYLANNKQRVASATVVHNKQTRSLSEMTQPEYASFVAKICEKRKNAFDMIYLNKMSRSQFLVTIDDAKMYYYDGDYKEITTTGQQMVYAIDRYGNLFCIDVPGFGSGIQMNHSSALAGKDVIGAGCLYVKNGSLRWIDNNSGHYQPTYQQLCNTLNVLMDQDLPLDDVLVGVMQTGVWDGKVATRHVWFYALDVIRSAPQLPLMSLSRPAPTDGS